MSLQIAWAMRGKILSIRVAIPRGSTFILSVRHPVLGFLFHLSQGSLKGLHYLEPLRVIGENVEKIEQPKPELLKRVEEGLKSFPPEPCEEGVNGSYLLRDIEGREIAIFKPTDEEGDSENNPKRSEGQDEFRNRGIPQGEGALREVAAYLLDSNEHFSGVPQTLMATLEHASFNGTKTGSLQEYVVNEGASWDVGPSRFPVQEVHKIGILDMRIFNNDRHGGNILMKENEQGNLELVPIDHGLSLSSTLDRAWFEWMSWPQAKKPFDEKSLSYIERIDIERDAKMLTDMGISEEAVRTMILSTTLLKKGAAAGLNLYQIGSIAARENLESPSLLEQIVKDSNDSMDIILERMEEEVSKIAKEQNSYRCEIL